MKKKVIIYTQAYNAESTLQRTIESIKKQTYEDWIWFIVDNASSDGTDAIIMRAAIEDERIIPYRLGQNKLEAYIKFWLLLKKNYPEDYFMDLDADDTVFPKCLENMVSYMEEQTLDIVACGTEFATIDDKDEERVVNRRELSANLLIEGDGFADKFQLYRPYTNEMWAKLYKFSVITEETIAVYSKHHFDSQMVLGMFSNAKRVGILAEILHKAYVGKVSCSQSIKGIAGNVAMMNPIENAVFHWIDGTEHIRVVSYKDAEWEKINMTFLQHESFLRQYGEISKANEEYLCAIYIGWIRENLAKLYLGLATHGSYAIYQNLQDLIRSDVFRKVFLYDTETIHYNNLHTRHAILEQMYNYVLFSEYAVANEEYVRGTKEIIRALEREMDNRIPEHR